ncbi:hypothetical protein AGOR_G00023400, partial [Albula goreensis]
GLDTEGIFVPSSAQGRIVKFLCFLRAKHRRSRLLRFRNNVTTRNMTSDNQNHSYSQLKEIILLFPTKQEKLRKWNVFVLILSLILGAEVIITTFLLYDLSKEINQVQEEARVGEYPLHCLDQLVDPAYQESASVSSNGLASCDLWIYELKHTAHKQLISDIRNALYWELTASNITLAKSNKPVIHMGAEHALRQFPDHMKNDGEKNNIKTMDNLRWDNINGLAVQQGMMGYDKVLERISRLAIVL